MPPTLTPLRTSGRAPRVLTIDVEDWFHVCGDDYFSDPRRWNTLASRVESNLTRVFETLGRGGHRATLFFLGWVAERFPDLVREAARRGHEVAVHGHLHRRADELSAEGFRDDLRRSRDLVESAGGGLARAHRAAEWSIRAPGDPALTVLVEEGFACDASITPIPPLGRSDNPPGAYRIGSGEGEIIEVPPLSGRGFGRTLPMGGGWPFRMFSARRVASAEDRFRSAGWPAVFTFHPWELDPAHPPMEGLAPLTRLVHFFNLGATHARLEAWLDRDRCVALDDVLPMLAG